MRYTLVGSLRHRDNKYARDGRCTALSTEPTIATVDAADSDPDVRWSYPHYTPSNTPQRKLRKLRPANDHESSPASSRLTVPTRSLIVRQSSAARLSGIRTCSRGPRALIPGRLNPTLCREVEVVRPGRYAPHHLLGLISISRMNDRSRPSRWVLLNLWPVALLAPRVAFCRSEC